MLPRLLTAAGKQQGDTAMPLVGPPRHVSRCRRWPAVIRWSRTSPPWKRPACVGRGGGGFPTGRKLRSVSEGGSRPVVVVNGSEGEPASAKDSLLMTRAPHLVLDGALLAAVAVGAREVIVCIERTHLGAIRSIEDAILERVQAREPMVPVRVCDLPPRYVAG